MGNTIGDFVRHATFECKPMPSRYRPGLPNAWVPRPSQRGEFIPMIISTPTHPCYDPAMMLPKRGRQLPARAAETAEAAAGAPATRVSERSTGAPRDIRDLSPAELGAAIAAAARSRDQLPDDVRRELQRAPAVFLFMHGNACDIGLIAKFMDDLARNVKVPFVALEYAGYGMCVGEPSERTLVDDALACFDWLAAHLGGDESRIVLVGKSVGSGPAIAVAVERPHCGGLVVISGFATIVSVYSGTLATSAPAIDMFRNIEIIDRVACYVAIIHGTHDTVVPYEHAVRLYRRVHPGNKSLLKMWGFGHNDIDQEIANCGILQRFIVNIHKCNWDYFDANGASDARTRFARDGSEPRRAGPDPANAAWPGSHAAAEPDTAAEVDATGRGRIACAAPQSSVGASSFAMMPESLGWFDPAVVDGDDRDGADGDAADDPPESEQYGPQD